MCSPRAALERRREPLLVVVHIHASRACPLGLPPWPADKGKPVFYVGPSGRSDGDGQPLQGAAAREQHDQRTGPEAIECSVGSHSGAAEVSEVLGRVAADLLVGRGPSARHGSNAVKQWLL